MKFLNFFSLNLELRNENLKGLEPSEFIKKKYVLKIFFLINDKIVIDKNNVFFYETSELKFFLKNSSKLILIGKKNKVLFFCKNISNIFFKRERIFYKKRTIKIREAINLFCKDSASLVTSGFFLSSWIRSNKYCGKCGFANKVSCNGHLLQCKNNKCNNKIFPRINPVIIVMVKYKNKILLASSHNWPKNLYSCLAGFCEHNESAEEAVKREVFEEVGLSLKKIKYKFSQSWPFPNNLMLGFEAEAITLKLKINKKEIEHAQWFTKDELAASVKNKKVVLPRKIAIARALIQKSL